VIAPKSIQSNSDYRLSLAATGVSKPTDVLVKLTYYADSLAAKAIVFAKPQLITIPDPNDLYCQSCEKNEIYVNWQPLPDSINLEPGNSTSGTWEKQNTTTLCAEEKSKMIVFQVSLSLFNSVRPPQ
jgi:hypothetical protein